MPKNQLITAGVPHFFQRSAVTRELYDLIVEHRPSSTSAGLAEHIKRMHVSFDRLREAHPVLELHLLEYGKRKLEYLRQFSIRPTSVFKPNPLQVFSNPSDASGYNDKSISDDMITALFIDFSERTQQAESQEYLRTLTGTLFMT